MNSDRAGFPPYKTFRIIGFLLVLIGIGTMMFGDVNYGEAMVTKVAAIVMGSILVVLSYTVLKAFHKK